METQGCIGIAITVDAGMKPCVLKSQYCSIKSQEDVYISFEGMYYFLNFIDVILFIFHAWKYGKTYLIVWNKVYNTNVQLQLFSKMQ